MPDPLKVQLRTFRRSVGLTQDDMGALLGLQSHSNVSRYERSVTEPDMRTAFAYEYVLGMPTAAIFAHVFDEVKRVVAKRATGRLNSLTHLLNDTKHATRLTHLSMLAEPQRTLFDV